MTMRIRLAGLVLAAVLPAGQVMPSGAARPTADRSSDDAPHRGTPFPDAAGRDRAGRPLLSWRVHLLPFLGEQALYRQFRLDEPWNSPHNRRLIGQMPEVYRVGSREVLAQGKTCLVFPIGPATAFPEGRGLLEQALPEATSNTILAVEADDAHAVIWTEPADLRYDAAHPVAGLGGHFGDVFLALFADGSVRTISRKIDSRVLRALFAPAGGKGAGIRWPGARGGPGGGRPAAGLAAAPAEGSGGKTCLDNSCLDKLW